MVNLYRRLIEFLFPRKFRVKYDNEIPSSLDSNTIYVIENWAICFICPCGCNEHIHLNTLISANPRWSYKLKKRKVSIYPSVRRITGCKSHFWITKDKLHWC